MATRHRLLVDGGIERTVVVDEAGDGIVVTVDEDDAIEVDVDLVGRARHVPAFINGQPARPTSHGAAPGSRSPSTAGASASARPQVAAGSAARWAARTVLGEITAPLAGVVVDVRVAVGDKIEAGQTLLVIEAMKMQNEIQAPQAGVVTAIHCEQGGARRAGGAGPRIRA